MSRILELISLDMGSFAKLDIKSKRRMVSEIAKMANQRMKRLEEAGAFDSPAYLKASKAKFGVRGKTDIEVTREYNRAKTFLSMKTSTKTGYLNWKITSSKAEALREKVDIVATVDRGKQQTKEELWGMIKEAIGHMEDVYGDLLKAYWGSLELEEFAIDYVEDERENGNYRITVDEIFEALAEEMENRMGMRGDTKWNAM